MFSVIHIDVNHTRIPIYCTVDESRRACHKASEFVYLILNGLDPESTQQFEFSLLCVTYPRPLWRITTMATCNMQYALLAPVFQQTVAVPKCFASVEQAELKSQCMYQLRWLVMFGNLCNISGFSGPQDRK